MYAYGFSKGPELDAALSRNVARLDEQHLMYANRRHALLVVLQRMDAAQRRHYPPRRDGFSTRRGSASFSWGNCAGAKCADDHWTGDLIGRSLTRVLTRGAAWRASRKSGARCSADFDP
jgi:hypothetical protein